MGMGRRFIVRYAATSDLRAQLEESEARGAILLPMPDPPDLGPLEHVALILRSESVSIEVEAEVLQILAGAGLVVRVLDTSSTNIAELPKSIGASHPPEVAEDDGTTEGGTGEQEERRGAPVPAGSSALSWPVEKLQAEWDSLSTPERIRVARYGNRGARTIASRGRDKTLQIHLLSNPNISTEEVAAMAGSAGLDPAALRRIASNREWLRSAEITRNLICNPTLPLPEVERLLRPLSQDELARIYKSGRVRASVRQAIQKRLARK